MYAIPCEKLKGMDVAELKKGLVARKLSVLKSLGASRLRAEMRVVGWVCQLVVWLIYRGAKDIWRGGYDLERPRRRTVRLVKFFFPVTLQLDEFEPSDRSALVIYFNHQSLFQVLAVIWYCQIRFPGKKCIFPVNLPWYEALCPVFEKLWGLGVCITPMITPSTNKKLMKIAGKDENRRDLISILKLRFEEEYSKMVLEFLQSQGIVAVAPSAGRSDFIFPSKKAYQGLDAETIKSMPRTMTMIVFSLRRKKLENLRIDFVPFVATRERPAGRGLNVFRRHDIYVGQSQTFEEVLERVKVRAFDYECYARLAHFVPENIKYEHGK